MKTKERSFCGDVAGAEDRATLNELIAAEHDRAAAAFDAAVIAGRLSADPTAINYAGHYMYMGRQSGRELFKHHMTRDYIA